MKQTDRETLRQRITELRRAMGITQCELARRSKLTPAAISQIESGIRLPMLSVFAKIADTLAVSMDYLVGRSESPEINSPTKSTEDETFYREFELLSKVDQDFVRATVEHLKTRKQLYFTLNYPEFPDS